MDKRRKPFTERALTSSADRTASRRRRAGSRRNKVAKTVGSFRSDKAAS